MNYHAILNTTKEQSRCKRNSKKEFLTVTHHTGDDEKVAG